MLKRIVFWCFFTRTGRWWFLSGGITIMLSVHFYPMLIAEAENRVDLVLSLIALPVLLWWFTVMILGFIVAALRPDGKD